MPGRLPPGLVIAAPASGAGKTTVTLGLLAAFRAAGVAVRPFKCGPDYIDPAFHRAASGRAAYNLDPWAMPGPLLDALAHGSAPSTFGWPGAGRGADPANGRLLIQDIETDLAGRPPDLLLAEGAMGLFDGAPGRGASGSGASAEIAARFGWPVVLVLDVSGQAQTAGAVAKGLAQFQPDVRVAGVILNRVASPRHARLASEGLAEAGIPVFGALPKRASITLPSRHLGLVQAEEQPGLAALLAEAGAFVAAHVDLGALRAAAGAKGATDIAEPAGAFSLPPPGQRIALARDGAFSFVYPHLLAGWRAAGAEIVPFSPLADAAPDADADCCWLPGGYPELHAGALAAAERFKAGLRAFASTRPVHGECGGYMALGVALIDADGQAHAMAGLLGLVSNFAERALHLGYRHARLLAPLPPYPPGTCLRGHEFHYARVLETPDAPLAAITDAAGETVAEGGARRGAVTGSFFHLIAPAP